MGGKGHVPPKPGEGLTRKELAVGQRRTFSDLRRSPPQPIVTVVAGRLVHDATTDVADLMYPARRVTASICASVTASIWAPVSAQVRGLIIDSLEALVDTSVAALRTNGQATSHGSADET